MDAGQTCQGRSRTLGSVRITLPSNYIVTKEKDNLWVIFVAGPETSPFEGGQFQVEFKLDNFPFKGPVVTYRTKIHHPNISEKGEVC